MAFKNSSREFTFRRKIITFRTGSRGFTCDHSRLALLQAVEEFRKEQAFHFMSKYIRVICHYFCNAFLLNSTALPLREIIQNGIVGKEIISEETY